ncbi:MAG TPA: flagellin [Opitutaceae bacterium]|nr:flagellin [Opitutaceae bacterium]
MRIASRTLQDDIVRQIQQLGTSQARLQAQVATGQRITRPEDDPAAAGRVLNHQSDLRRVDQFTRNADRALALSQASFSGLTNLKKLSDRAGEIATLGQGAASAEAMDAYAAEVNQLLEQMLQLGNAKLGNDHLFAGAQVDAAPFAATRDAQGRITAVAYAGDAVQTAIPLSDTASVSPFTSGATNAGVRDLMNELVALRDALSARDPAAVSAAQAGLVAGEDLLVSALAEHGAVQLRIEVNRAQQQAHGDDIVKLVTTETSVDLPDAIVRLNQAQTAYQAALQSSANIMQLSLLDYIR